jgi:Tfp pilus assembly protein PilN
MIYGRLYTRSLGVHITRTDVRAVEMIRVGTWVRCRRTWTIPIESDLPGALRVLRAATRPASLRVVTHVDPLHVRATVQNGEAVESAYSEWRQHVVSELLPQGARDEAFASAFRLVRLDEERASTEVAVVARHAIGARIREFEEAGLAVTFVGVLGFELPNACVFNPDFRDHCRAIIFQHDAGHEILQFEDGILSSCRPAKSTALDDVLADVEGLTEAKNGDVWYAPNDAGAAVQAHSRLRLLQPLEGLAGRRPTDPLHAAATGLALRGLYFEPGSTTEGSFLEAPSAVALHRRHEESLRRHLAISLGGLALVLLLSVTSVEWWFSKQLREAELDLAPLAATLASFEREESLTRRLTADVATAEERAAARTQAAATLSAVADLTPDGIRWEEVILAIDGDESPRLVLKGVARADASLSTFLRSLERANFTGHVRLVLTEVVAPRSRVNSAPPDSVPQRRFDIEATIPRASITPTRTATSRREQ